MRGTKWLTRAAATIAIGSVVLAVGIVSSPSAVAAPPVAPWTDAPPVGSWLPLDTPSGQIPVKIVAPGIAVHPGQVDDGQTHIWTGIPPRPAYSAARQELFVAKVEALIAYMQTTPVSRALLAGFGITAPLPNAETGSFVKGQATYTSNGQAVAINELLAISPDAEWLNVTHAGISASNGEGSVSHLNVPEDMSVQTWQLGDIGLVLTPGGAMTHELIHGWRALNGYQDIDSPPVRVEIPVNGNPLPHLVPREEALTTGSPLLLMNAQGYTLAPNGQIVLNPDPAVVRAIDLASDREALLLRRLGPRADDSVASFTVVRTLGQGFTEHSYYRDLGLVPRETYGYSLEGSPPMGEFEWTDSSLETFVDALQGFTRADQTQPEASRWLKPRAAGPPSACGTGTHLMCALDRVPPSAVASKALADWQAAVGAGNPVVTTPVVGPVLSPTHVQAMSAKDLLAVAQGQFDVLLRTHGSFGGVGDSGKVFVGLPKTRDVLNRVDVGGSSATGQGLDGLDYVDWVKSLKSAFGADVSNLQTAATLTAMVPLIAESMGIAAAVESGDKAAIAANAVSLLSSIASLFITNPTVGLVVGMIGMLVAAFIYAFSMPDPSPVALEHLKKYRDKAFGELIPKLAKDFTAAVSEAFAVSQAQQVIALGVADAMIDRTAELAAVTDPVKGRVFAEDAVAAKAELHAQLQVSLSAQKQALSDAMKAAFRELITTEVNDPVSQRLVTEEVLPLYEHADGGYAWDDGTDAVTPGWEYFVSVAENNQDFACLTGRDPGGRNRTASDFAAGADLRDCADTIYVMNTTYVPNVKKLASTSLVAPAATVLAQVVDAGLLAPQTVRNLTVATIPAPKKTTRDRPWQIVYPAGGAPATPAASPAAPAPVPGLITGTGKAGHTIQVRDQDAHVLCSTDVNVYGTWGCVTSDLIAPGFALTIWENNTSLGVTTTAPGTRLAIAAPAPNAVSPDTPLALSGTGTAGHQLTLTLHHPAGDQPATTDLIVPEVGAAGAWSATIPTGTLRPGRTYSVTVADKSTYDFRSATFTTTGTASAPPSTPFEAHYEAETASTGGTVSTLPDGRQGRKYTTDQEAGFRVEVPSAGDYRVAITYNAASRGNGTLVTVYPNNSSVNSQRTEVTSSATKAAVVLKLNAGSNDIILVPPPGKGLPDLDLITLTRP